MITTEELAKKFIVTGNKRQVCTICGERIPGEVKRVSIMVSGTGYHSNVRLCAMCITRMNDMVDKESLKMWDRELTEDEI